MRVGIVGFGLMGQRRAAVLGEDELVGHVDPMSEDGVSLGELATMVDAMIVSTPTPLLAETVMRCIEMGVTRILVEKPCAVTSRDLKCVVGRMFDTGAVVVPAYTLRHWPGVQDMIAEGKQYGRLLYMRAVYGHGGGATGWRAMRDGGGELLDQGSHLIDLAQVMIGDMVVNAAQLMHYANMPVEDNAWIHLGGGPQAMLHASWTEWKPTFEVVAIYERGRIQVSGLQGPYGPHTISFRGLRELHRKTEYSNVDVLRNEWEAFKIHTPQSSLARMNESVRTLELIEEAKRCAS